MDSQEREQIEAISRRLVDVSNALLANDAENLSNQDLEDLAQIITNISGVLKEMACQKADRG